MNEKQKWFLMLLGYIGSLTLAEWQLIVAILGGLSFVVYTCMQAFVFWRDKVRRHGGRSGDTAVEVKHGE
jgi:hypothetical protein